MNTEPSVHVLDVAERAALTFVELYIAVSAITPVNGWKTAAAGGFGALLSVIWNTGVKLRAAHPELLEDLEDEFDSFFDDEPDETALQDDKLAAAEKAAAEELVNQQKEKAPAPGSNVQPTQVPVQVQPTPPPVPAEPPIGSQAQ